MIPRLQTLRDGAVAHFVQLNQHVETINLLALPEIVQLFLHFGHFGIQDCSECGRKDYFLGELERENLNGSLSLILLLPRSCQFIPEKSCTKGFFF